MPGWAIRCAMLAVAAGAGGAARADTPASAHAFFVQFDADRDGRWSSREYRVATRRMSATMRSYLRLPRGVALPRELRLPPFSAQDLDGDGFIAEDEVARGGHRGGSAQTSTPPSGEGR